MLKHVCFSFVRAFGHWQAGVGKPILSAFVAVTFAGTILGQERLSIKHGDSINCLAISPDGRTLGSVWRISG
jgi:hypothetical protein